MAVIQQFRTAVRGFNRQDVQDYIEQLAAVHRQETAELRKQLEKSDRRIQELEETASNIDAMTAELAQTRSALESADQMVSRLRGELSQADAKLSVAKKERLQTQIAALEPLAAGYQEIRDRAANVELDAHQKAQAAVNEAKTEVERIRGDTRRWLSQVMEEYSTLRYGLDGVLEQIQTLAKEPEKVAELDKTAKKLRLQGGLK
jgi:chromosome segregation ATPase